MLSLCVYGKWAAACLRELGGTPGLPSFRGGLLTGVEASRPRWPRPSPPFTVLLYMESVPLV